MLSADVPEFVPRAHQNLGSPSNTAATKPEERTQAQQTTWGTRGKATQGSRFSYTRALESSWRERRETATGQLGHSRNPPKDVWRQSGEPRSWRDQTHRFRKHERTEAPETYASSQTSEKVQRGRGRGHAMRREDLESQIKNKFVTPKNGTPSYTRILKNSPQSSPPERKPSKQDFSLSIDSQWPTLGGGQPQNINQGNESITTESTTNAWGCRSSELSPAKSPTKKTHNPWEVKDTEVTKSPSVRPKTTKEHYKPLENVQIKGASKPNKKVEMKGDSRKLEDRSGHAPKNMSDKPKIQRSDASALNTDDNSSGISKLGEADNVTKNSTADDDSDPFEWKVIGERKKKVKIKEDEAHGSPRPQELRGDGKKYVRNANDKPSRGAERKQTQEYSGKGTKKDVSGMSSHKSVHLSQERHGESNKDPTTTKSVPREGKKSRPTKVASLANCSSDKREVRSAVKKSTAAVAAVKPVDEETLQKRLAAKLLKQEEKRKRRERKAQLALLQNRPKDTKVSFITTDFLQKTQASSKTPAQQSGHDETIAFTSEEYPSLQIQRHKAPSAPPLERITHLKTSAWSGNKERLSEEGKVPSDSSIRLKKGDICSPERGAAASEEQGTYRTALLAARLKENHLKPTLSITKPQESVPVEAVQKKKLKTSDRIELDLFALAARGGKKKKKDLLAEKYSQPKRKHMEGVEEHDGNAFPSQTVLTAHLMLNKGATVVAKRGKISTKPKKKKVSRIKKCQMERAQRDILALQLLLEQAKLRAAQQSSVEASTLTITEVSDSCKESTENGTIEQASSTSVEDQEKYDDKGRSTPSAENEKETDEDNKENTRLEVPSSSTNSQTSNTQPNKSDSKPKIIWVLNKTENASSQGAAQNTNSGMKTEDNGEGAPGNQQLTKEGSPTSPASPTHQELMNDPLVVKRASELASFVKSQGQKSSREYVHQVVTPEVNAVAKELMQKIISFQERHYQRDPVRARIKRRYVCGMKETTKLMGKMSCVIMAPNIEQCEGPGSLDDTVEKLLNQAEKHKVPVVFALSMRIIKKLCHKNSKRVSCFGIISYQGAQDHFKHLMELLPEAKKQYQQLVACGQCTVPKEGDEEEEGVGDEGKEEAKEDLTKEIIARTNALLTAP